MIRLGFVSNSSSTAFTITNKTDKMLTLLDFAQETVHLVEEFNGEYGYSENEKNFLQSARDRVKNGDETAYIKPGKNEMGFGDEDGDLLGKVYDYMLRDGGSSKRFDWRFLEYWR